MPRPIGDKSFQTRVRPCWIGTQFVKQRTNRVNHINVHLFGRSANIVSLAKSPALQDCPDCPAVILDEQPVADVFSFAVDRKRLALDRIADD